LFNLFSVWARIERETENASENRPTLLIPFQFIFDDCARMSILMLMKPVNTGISIK